MLYIDKDWVYMNHKGIIIIKIPNLWEKISGSAGTTFIRESRFFSNKVGDLKMDWNMKQVQEKILEVALYLDEFCTENHIEYYLMGGSALGAMRHQGFIPWDDDFDVFMDYDNYVKFLEAGRKNLDGTRFYLQEENSKEWPLFFTKLRMNHTTFLEEDILERDMHKGFYVDVMCLNHAPDFWFFRFLQYGAARLLVARTLGQKGYATDNLPKKIALALSALMIRGAIFNGLLRFVRHWNHKDTLWVGHYFGRAKFPNTSFPKEFLGVPRRVPFEGNLLPVPERVEEYLALRYGPRYMDIPDEKTKAKYPVHAVFVDPDHDYRDYESVENGRVRSFILQQMGGKNP